MRLALTALALPALVLAVAASPSLPPSHAFLAATGMQPRVDHLTIEEVVARGFTPPLPPAPRAALYKSSESGASGGSKKHELRRARRKDAGPTRVGSWEPVVSDRGEFQMLMGEPASEASESSRTSQEAKPNAGHRHSKEEAGSSLSYQPSFDVDEGGFM